MVTLQGFNSLQERERSDRVPDPCMVVIFGASGDLTRRKLIPALLELARQKLLPKTMAVVGVARTPMTSEGFREYLRAAAMSEGDVRSPDRSVWESFARGLFYVSMDPGIKSGYGRLRKELETISRAQGLTGNILWYLATPPSLYAPIVHALGASGLAGPSDPKSWTRIIIEKPFGTDLASAKALNTKVQEVFREEQIYRIDHYLGKETVQNLLVFRFANGIFEPIWNRNYIDHVQITAAESVGVENRGGYYEQAGAMRDMVQNHIFQLIALTAMEPPVLFDAEQVRDEKHKIFQAMRSIPPEEVHHYSIRGQYTAGTVAGTSVPDYCSERGVSPESLTETYVALKFYIDNWRWAGVPFYVRSGKALPKRVTEIAVQFKKTPHHLFTRLPPEHLESNTIAIRIQPDEGISLKFSAKIPGSAMRMRPVLMDFRYGSAFGGRLADAYTRLLLDCMLGDATLYARCDSVEAAWSLITRIHEGWASNPTSKVYRYPAGTWGPKEADSLLSADGRFWRSL